MESGADIVIDDCFVIHVLDNRLPAAQCSQTLTALPDSFRATLQTYVHALLQPGFRRKRYGRFRPESPVWCEYRRLLAATTHGRVPPSVFLEVSQRLATLLFTAMGQGKGGEDRGRRGVITSGDLLVGLFSRHAPDQSPVPYLYLIKVDLEVGLQRQLRPLPQGGIQTVLAPCDGLLPRLTAEHIHKSAFIRCDDDSSPYDVLMTDPQGGRTGVAKFFAEDFLQADVLQTPDEQAEFLFMRTCAWIREQEHTLTPQEQQQVLQAVRTQITDCAQKAEPLKPADLVVSIPLTEPRPEEMVHELRLSFQETITTPPGGNGGGVPLESELLLQTVPARVARVRMTYQLDDGVQLSGDQQALERLFARPPHRIDGATEFTIRTATFRPLV